MRANAKMSACVSVTRSLTIGRFEVRAINLSISLSMTMLNAFAAPAAKVPPINVANVIPSGGMPLAARNSAGKVVTSNSSTTRSFMSAIYAEITRRDYPVDYGGAVTDSADDLCSCAHKSSAGTQRRTLSRYQDAITQDDYWRLILIKRTILRAHLRLLRRVHCRLQRIN